VNNKRDLSADDANLLRELGARLDAHVKGKSLEPDQAAVFRDELNRIAGPKWTLAEELEMCVVCSYLIRKELAGPGKSKLARAEAATACGVADLTVQTYNTRWNRAAVTLINRQALTSRYAGLTRPQMLEKLLAVYEKFAIPDLVKRKQV
jgi:hypothetical protein